MTRIVFAGGGTGGHLYPGLAIARALVRRDPSVEPFFVGAQRGIERDVLPTTEFPHVLLDLHPLYRTAVWNNWQTIARRDQRAGGSIGATGASRSARRWSSAPAATRRASCSPTRVVHRIPIVQQAGDSHPGPHGARVQPLVARDSISTFPRRRGPHGAHAGSLIDTGAPIEPPPSPRPDRAAARVQLGLSGARADTCCSSTAAVRARSRSTASSPSGSSADCRTTCTSSGGRAARRTSEFKHLESDRVRVRDYLVADRRRVCGGRPRARARRRDDDGRAVRLGDSGVLVPLPTAAADHQTTQRADARARRRRDPPAAVAAHGRACSRDRCAGVLETRRRGARGDRRR